MFIRNALISVCLLAIGWPGENFAQQQAVTSNHVEARLLAETMALLRGGETALAVELTPEPGWHTYWINPGDTGGATQMVWTLPEGVSAGAIQWPTPSAISAKGLVSYGFTDPSLYLVNLSVPANWPLNRSVPISLRVEWLACKELCVPGSAELSMTLPVADEVELSADQAAWFEEARAAMPELLAGWEANFALDGSELSLALNHKSLGEIEDAEFFPQQPDLLNHSARLRFARDGIKGIRLTQPVSRALNNLPNEVRGVLVVTREGGAESAYLINAQPGPVTAVPEAKAGATEKPATKAGGPAAQAVAPSKDLNWPLALLFALLGGVVLNLMPCVFPVLSLKAYSVMGSQGAPKAEQRAQALAYAAGAVLSCVVAAAILLGLRAGGEALGWGFQLQSPAFVAAMIYLLLALGLAMSGVLELGSGMMNMGSGLAARQGLTGSFFTGVLAVVVASPCTAPFMGSALGFAVTQPLLIALSVFAALGLGLSLPFLVLGFFPALANTLPRPGPWMLLFKQAMAFPLYFTCAWLAWVLTRQAGADALGLTAFGMVCVALAVWLFGRPQRQWISTGIATLFIILAIATLAASAFRPAELTGTEASEKHAGHEAWSSERVAELRAQGRTIFVNFTADWCITCKVNERGALRSDLVTAALAANNVVWLTGDWTRSDPKITQQLALFARNGVPLYLIYAKGGEPQILPQVLTPQVIVDALNGSARAP